MRIPYLTTKSKLRIATVIVLVLIPVALTLYANANTKSAVKTKQTGNGVEVTLTLKAPICAYTVYEEIYQNGRLISGKPKVSSSSEHQDWGDMPYKETFELRVKAGQLPDGGFSGQLTSFYAYPEDDVGMELNTKLPRNVYTGMAHILGTGNAEATLSKDKYSIDAGDDVILMSIVLSTEPNGEICVYNNGRSLSKCNDTVVQYRLVTSTESVPFEAMPLDLAQTLYDLRVETLNDRDDPGAQEAIRTLLDALGISEFGPYELEYYDMTRAEHVSTLNLGNHYWPGGTEGEPPYEKTALVVRFTEPFGPEDPSLTNIRHDIGDLLLVLVPDLDEVHVANKKANSGARYSYVVRDEDLEDVADFLGKKSIEELGQSAKNIRALMEFIDFENSIPKISNTGVSISTEERVALDVTDLISVFDTVDLAEAILINHTETETTYSAKAAIRAESYIEELKSFTWEEYTPPVEWNRKDGFFCQLITNDVTITAFQSGYSDSRPLHLVTDEGEGWFVLPYIQSEPDKAIKQVSWMIYDTFFSWCLEAEAATLYSTGGKPLTVEELNYFGEYTSSHRSVYDEEDGSYTVGTTEISCFFTSQYSDPRDINAGEFLAYCPDEDVLTKEDKDEFRLVQEKLDWRVGADNHLATFDEFPVPCHRIPRTFLNGILMKYAGITVEDMNTNWMEEAFYIPQTDCFYTFTSDFGPGEFRPCYGEKNEDFLTLWEELNA